MLVLDPLSKSKQFSNFQFSITNFFTHFDEISLVSSSIRFLRKVINNSISFTSLPICNFIYYSKNTSCIVDSPSGTYFRCYFLQLFLNCFISGTQVSDLGRKWCSRLPCTSFCDVLMSEDIPLCNGSLIWSVRLSNLFNSAVSTNLVDLSKVEHVSSIPS